MAEGTASGAGVLIVGARRDPHVQRVLQRLRERAAGPVAVVDPFDERPSEFSFSIGRDGRRYRVDGSHLDPSAIWWRVKPSLAYPNSRLGDEVTRQFVEREWLHCLESLAAAPSSATWVNPRAVDQRVRHKPLQLAEAVAAGFPIPPTLISNDPGEIGEFVAAAQPGAVYKPLSWYARKDRLLYTSTVSPARVAAADAASLRIAPGIFQQRIEKSFELRITVVGEEPYGVRIDSQHSSESAPDWRRAHSASAYSAWTPPDDFVAQLLALHRALGLVYGAYDFIVTPEGDCVFLEVNPVGQWLWLEDATGVPIADAIARTLLAER